MLVRKSPIPSLILSDFLTFFPFILKFFFPFRNRGSLFFFNLITVECLGICSSNVLGIESNDLVDSWLTTYSLPTKIMQSLKTWTRFWNWFYRGRRDCSQRQKCKRWKLNCAFMFSWEFGHYKTLAISSRAHVQARERIFLIKTYIHIQYQSVEIVEETR